MRLPAAVRLVTRAWWRRRCLVLHPRQQLHSAPGCPLAHQSSDPEKPIMPSSARICRGVPYLVLASALVALAGCASVTPIGQLMNDPSHYNGKTVRIEGEVKESAGGFGLGAYQVKDDTGTLTVVSETGGPPRSGTKIGVKGRFQALFTIGSKGLAVLREESRSLR
jgi:hypothetical protein